jgi:Ca2+-binding RTX toxin-like protein
MALLSGFNVTLSEVELLGQASLAAFAGGAIPNGWSVVTPDQLGLGAYADGNYFTNQGASAIVLQQGSTYIVSFRGTDGTDDIFHYPELLFGTYINNFSPLLSALAAASGPGAGYYFTGASLGGGATNLMANIAGSQYGGEYAAAKFVAFASPILSNSNGILNIGAENDPVYKAINSYGDFSSSLDNIVLASPEYMAGNYDGRHPFDAYAHESSAVGFDALGRLSDSLFYNSMSPDSVIILDATPGWVQDITPGRESTGAFYLGEAVHDVIYGRDGADHIEGFGAEDWLYGGYGNDVVSGGQGPDWLEGEGDKDIVGGGGDIDYVYGGAGNDIVRGGSGADYLDGGLGNDRYWGGPGADTFAFDGNFGFDVVRDFTPAQDVIDLSGTGLVFSQISMVHAASGTMVYTPHGNIDVDHVWLNSSDFIF